MRPSGTPKGFTYVDSVETVTGRWETDHDGGFIAEDEADGWRPSIARALAA